VYTYRDTGMNVCFFFVILLSIVVILSSIVVILLSIFVILLSIFVILLSILGILFVDVSYIACGFYLLIYHI